MKRRVLFVCTANSARSLMAEALLRKMAGDEFEVASAGTEPAAPHPLALQVLSEAGIPTEGLSSKPLQEVENQHWDYVIMLCERATRECGSICQPAQQIAWDFPDPAATNRHGTFVLTLKDLKERIKLFATVHQKVTRKLSAENPVALFKALSDEFRLAALLLIRDQGSLCVCELTEAFDVPQPKVSRHLSTLKEVGLLNAERRGQWIYYSIDSEMPGWVAQIVNAAADNSRQLVEIPLRRLEAMSERPGVPCP
ncbi:metalloregulator ArsR/SmtB family transcription factor [Marinobacter salinexigens]|uniref:Metalloregulator ArsR/SmtB family transcription factor n=1 Tax=Marinobacter salinexigens TaxID=2919747 RepID=A0A5B0VAN7_9GAMM|nr:metalloregulator ArsR/SmtB family transcription factor [Marinobacter salinexigens]KAA1171428.1 metalloregulator ArsR/SmtB family transcription factor [Marinobacter salinexigens]